MIARNFKIDSNQEFMQILRLLVMYAEKESDTIHYDLTQELQKIYRTAHNLVITN